MAAASAGLRSFNTSKVSAQTAQYAAGEVRVAARRPSPPSLPGSVAKLRACSGREGGNARRRCREVHMRASWASAYGRAKVGGSDRRRWLARGEAQKRRRSQAGRKSGKRGNQ